MFLQTYYSFHGFDHQPQPSKPLPHFLSQIGLGKIIGVKIKRQGIAMILIKISFRLDCLAAKLLGHMDQGLKC